MSGLDLRVPFDVCQDAFGLPGTVTRPAPDDDPIETTVVWVPPVTQDVPANALYQKKDSFRVLAISKADVPTVPTGPNGTRIVCAEELGGTSRTWRADAMERVEADHVRVVVIPVSA